VNERTNKKQTAGRQHVTKHRSRRSGGSVDPRVHIYIL